MMSFGTPVLSNIASPMKYKQQYMRQQAELSRHKQHLHWQQQISLPLPTSGISPELHVSYLQQGIAAYMDTIQAVCKVGSYVADSLYMLMEETTGEKVASHFKNRFTDLCRTASQLHVESKNEFAQLLMEFTLPDNCDDQSRVLSKWKQQNSKVLEKCVKCLEKVQTAIFNSFLSDSECVEGVQNTKADITSEHPPVIFPQRINDFALTEWHQLRDVGKCCSSWRIAKQMTDSLRKNSGLTEPEIQNLLKSSSVADSYVKKLNNKITSALKNYTTTLRSLSLPLVVVNGGFYLSPEEAKTVLVQCCNKMEMEQGVERLPVDQFLLYELPLIQIKIGDKMLPADSTNSAENGDNKKEAVDELVQNTNGDLAAEQRRDMTNEILADACPARWRSHVKATLQLLFGNAGLVVIDTIESDSKQKESVTISKKSMFVVVTVPSTWCVKEDPGTMLMLHRNVDPEKSIALIQVRYVAVYNTASTSRSWLEPGIFVEVSLRNAFGKKQTLFPASMFWMEDDGEGAQRKAATEAVEAKSGSKAVEEGTTDEPGKSPGLAKPAQAKAGGEVESDSEEAVQDAIKLLSGSLKIRKAECATQDDESKVPEEGKRDTESQDGQKTVANEDCDKSSTPSDGGSPVVMSKSNTAPARRKPYNQRYSGPKSASFTAFDKSMKMRYQKPVLLVRTPQHAIANTTLLQTLTQQSHSPIYLQPNLTSFQRPPHYQPRLAADGGVLQRPLFMQPTHLQNFSPPQLAQAPVAYFPPRQALLPQTPDNLAQSLLKSQSANDLATAQSTQLQHLLQQHQKALQQQDLYLASGDLYAGGSRTGVLSSPHRMAPDQVVLPPAEQGSNVMSSPSRMSNAAVAEETSFGASLGPQASFLFSPTQQHPLHPSENHLPPHLHRSVLNGCSPKPEDLGPIGSPVTSRRVGAAMDDGPKGSNTWPNARNQSSLNDFAQQPDEPDYARYIAGIKQALAHKTVKLDDLAPNLPLQSTDRIDSGRHLSAPVGEDVLFNAFSTPDLVQHIMPRKTTGDDVMPDDNGVQAPRPWHPWQDWPSEGEPGMLGWLAGRGQQSEPPQPPGQDQYKPYKKPTEL